MIEFLSHWMRGLILVIFLAVFLDMLLPSNKMQRYVRLVMGLLIILIMLNPVLKIYNGSSAYEMDLSLDTMLQGESGGGMPSVNQVLAQGEALSQNASHQTVDQWKQVIDDHISRTVESAYPVTVERVDVTFAMDDAGNPQALAGLDLIVNAQENRAAVQPVKPVEPVMIGGEANVAADTPSAREGDRTTLQQIRQQLAQDYQLSVDDVHVNWHES
ncbi:MAG TPA: stage III sporulation protein AF [Bacilli bacterium]|nr:stage III sporulation protein AF [Bacilli bacterium]